MLILNKRIYLLGVLILLLIPLVLAVIQESPADLENVLEEEPIISEFIVEPVTEQIIEESPIESVEEQTNESVAEADPIEETNTTEELIEETNQTEIIENITEEETNITEEEPINETEIVTNETKEEPIEEVVEKNFIVKIADFIIDAIRLIKGEVVSMSAKLVSLNDTPIPNKTLSFYSDSSFIDSAFTDEFGVAEVNWNPNEIGNFTVYVKNDEFNLSLGKEVQVIALEEILNETTNHTFEVNSLVQGQAEIGKPVEWVQNIQITNLDNETKEIEINSLAPEEAEISEVKDKKKDKKILVEESIVEEVNVSGKHKLNFEDKKSPKAKSLVFTDSLESNETKEYEIKYKTPAPEKFETEEVFEDGKVSKNITIRSNASVHYQNVLSYASIPESEREEIHLYWMFNGSKIDVVGDERYNVSFYDTNNNSFIDKISWIVPQLSEQNFVLEIIYISYAEHLDSNKTFVSEISDYVIVQDNNWSERINGGEYVRVVFEQELDNTKDITIYARGPPRDDSGEPNSSILQVYEENKSEVIATFPEITTEGLYKVYLTELNETQDTFDLKVVGDYLEFDWIVDPQEIVSVVLNSTDGTNTTDEDLNGYCNATNDGGAALAYQYTWYNSSTVYSNGTLFKEGSIDSGSYHTCGIRANDSRVLCWGNDGNNQLGNGVTADNIEIPTLTTDTSAYASVSAGADHTCGIRANDSRVLCWGKDSNGELGDGSPGVNSSSPMLTTDTSAYTSVSAGGTHTCGIRANDSRVLCWGKDDYGQSGDNNASTIAELPPTPTFDDSAYTFVSAGGSHTCGIRANDSRVLCWGNSMVGQIGNGELISKELPTLTSDDAAYDVIHTTENHICGIRTNDSRVLCWGRNDLGQLGNGAPSEYSSIPIQTSDTSAYVSVATGIEHTCGIRANDSRVLCWGEGLSGRLGYGGTDDQLNPTLTSDNSSYAIITLGTTHTCGAHANDSRVLCWGGGTSGQLGDNTFSNHNNPTVTFDNVAYLSGFIASEEVLVSTLDSSVSSVGENWTFSCSAYNFSQSSAWVNSSVLTILSASTIPEINSVSLRSSWRTNTSIDPLNGYCNATDEAGLGLSYDYTWYNNSVFYSNGTLFKRGSILVGVGHVCGIRANDSRVLCWGKDANGQLGDGSDGSDKDIPTLTTDTSDYYSITAGRHHTCAIRANDSRALCWGYGGQGRLGNGDLSQKNSPTLINDSSAYEVITAGAFDSCGIRKNDSRVLCWGASGFGAPKKGVQKNPILIEDTSAYLDVAAGNGYACGIRANDSRVLCWGRGSSGQLGYGSRKSKRVPILTSDTSAYISISVGYFHTCGIRKNDSRVLCWGSGSSGQIGDGEINAKEYNPTLTTDTSAYVSIASGDSHTCGIRANDSRVLCWGGDASGQLGDGGTNTNTNTPTLTTDTSAYLDLAAGDSNTCGIQKSNGQVYCWGSDEFGQIGDSGTNTNKDIPTITNDSSTYSLGFTGNREILLSILESSVLTEGDNWTFSCKASNLEQSSNWVNSSDLEIIPSVLTVNITSPANNSQTTDSSPEISFNLTDNIPFNVQYQIFIDGAVVSHSGNDTSLNGVITTVTILSAMALGEHNVTVNAMDGTGNSVNATINLTIVPPAVYLTSPSYDDVLNYSDVNFTFRVEDPTSSDLSCELLINDVLNQTNGTTLENTVTSFIVNSLAEGLNQNWTINCTNDASVSTYDTWLFGIDTVYPVINFTNETTAVGNYNQNWIFANATVNEVNVNTITLYLYNTTHLIDSGTSATEPFEFNFSELDDGTYYLNATVNDSAGNVNFTETRTIVIDTSAADSVVLNTTYGLNTTGEDLTAYPNPLNSSLKYIYDWKKNGSSITVLNMPFEGGSNSTFTKDYSDGSNNGNVSGVTYNSTGGYDSLGAYRFDGDGDKITAPMSLPAGSPVSVVFWNYVATADLNNAGAFSGNQGGDGTSRFMSHAPYSTNVLYWDYGDQSVNGRLTTSYASYLDKWTHIVLVSEGTGGNFKGIYFDGVLVAQGDSSDGMDVDVSEMVIGQAQGGNSHNGSIDEFQVYDRVLSVEQVLALYNNRTDLIALQETSIGENWSVSVTSNNGTIDGASVQSNNITILTSLFINEVVLNSTLGTNTTFEDLIANPIPLLGDLKYIYDWSVDGSSIINLNMPFEGGSTTTWTRDYSENGNNGTVVGATWSATSGHDGFGAYEFDGTNDYVSAIGTSIEYRTIEVWFNRDEDVTTASAYQVISSFDDTSTKWLSSGACCTGGGLDTETLVLSYGGGNTYIADNYAQGWHHLVLVWNQIDDKYDIYLDGVEKTTYAHDTSGNANLITESRINLGARFDGTPNGYFNGHIDDYKVWSVSLSAEQVLAIYNNRTGLIVSEETTVGENWSVAVTPNDGTADGAVMLSNNLTVLVNILPNVTSVILNSTLTGNETFENLTSYAINVIDGDDHNVKLIYDWKKEGSSIAVLNMPFEGYRESEILKGAPSSYDSTSYGWGNAYLESGCDEEFTSDQLDSFAAGISPAEIVSQVGVVGSAVSISLTVSISDTQIYRKYGAVAGSAWDSQSTESKATSNSHAMVFVCGKVKDYSDGNNSGIVNGVTYNLTGGYDGGGAYDFNNAVDVISIADSSEFTLSDDYTVEVWINPEDRPNGRKGIMGTYTGGSSGFILELKDNDINEFGFWTDSVWRYSGQEILEDGTWKHVAYTRSGTTGTFYYNGVNVSTVVAVAGTNGGALHIGDWGTGGTGLDFYGLIDDVKIYNGVALSAEQIQASYNNRTDLIVSQETYFDEVWQSCVTPNDGFEDGLEVCSNNLTIVSNALPNVSSVILNSSVGTNVTGEDLTAYVNATDYDNHSVKSIYDWRKNGSSIAVLNMPFEAGSNSTWTRDYSSYGNNGTVSGATYNLTGGYDGKGAYEFDGNDYIDMGTSPLYEESATSLTVSAWVYTSSASFDGDLQRLIDTNGGTGGNNGFGLSLEDRGTQGINAVTFLAITTVSTYRIIKADNVIGAEGWYHIVGTYDGVNVAKIYVNGVDTAAVVRTAGTGAFIPRDDSPLRIGSMTNSVSYNFTGKIDEVLVYDYVLSLEQVLVMYNNRTDVMVSQETSIGENWSVAVTPNDGLGDGATVLSNNLTVLLNNIPNVTLAILNSTLDGNETFENLTAYAINVTDEENHSVKLIYDWKKDGSSIAVLNMPFEGGSNSTFTKDYSDGSNNGTVSGATWNSTGGYDGNGSYYFNTDNDVITIADSSDFTMPNDYTLEAWINPDDVANDAKGIFGTFDSAGFAFGLGNADSNNLTFAGSGSWKSSNQTVLEDGTWKHVAYTRVGTTGTFYYNGVSVYVISDAEAITNGGELHIGDGGTAMADNDFRGLIDDVKIYNGVALSAEQIQASYNSRPDLIVSNETYFDEVWQFCVTPNDGFDDGVQVCSNNLTIIANTLPNVTSVILNSTTIYNITNEDLTAYGINTTDYDSHSVKLIYDWKKNGSSIAVLNMPFEGGSNSTWTKDYSDGSNNGTVSGATWSSTGGYDGKGGYEFDGGDDKITMGGYKGILEAASRTITAWVKTSDSNGAPIVYWGKDANGQRWRMWIEADGDLRVDVYSGSQVGTTNLLNDGEWHFVSAVLADGESPSTNDIKLYVDGVEGVSYTTDDEPINTVTDGDLVIGYEPTDGYYFDGSIDDFMIYDEALSDEQISAMYNNRTDMIVSQETTAGENWSVSVTPNDGLGDGVIVQSNNLTVRLNTLPTISSVILNSTTEANLTSEDLTAYVIDVADLDEHSVKLIYDWKKDGSSVAVLNMPFEGGSNSTWTKDYSGNNDNVSINGSTWNSTEGYDGKGAYDFDGVDDSIIIEGNSIEYKTIEFRINNNRNLVGIEEVGQIPISFGTGQNKWIVFGNCAGSVVGETFCFGAGGTNTHIFDEILQGWHHFALVWNESNYDVYMDGTKRTTAHYSGSGAQLFNETTTTLGKRNYAGEELYFNGSIDEYRIWDVSLSAEQVLTLYNSQTNLIVSNETFYSEVWQSCVTPNDGLEDGVEVCSNNLTIFEDAISPVFINITNQTIEYGTSLTYDIDASDLGGIDCFTVNDTTNFKINCSGYLENNTILSAGLYNLNISVNDSFENKNSSLMWVNVTPVSSISFSSSTSKSGDILIMQNNIPIDVSFGGYNVTVYLYNSTRSLVGSLANTTSPYLANFTGLSAGVYYFNATTFAPSFSNSTQTRNILVSPDGGGNYTTDNIKIANGLADFSPIYMDWPSWFGYSVANIGDLDGDGIQDLAVGAPFDENTQSREGAIYILFMNTDGTVASDVKISGALGDFYPSNLDMNDNFGTSIANIGDLDGDGVQDLAVGAMHDENSQSSEGAIYILFMNTDGTVSSNVKISDQLGGFTPSGLGKDDKFGSSIANIGDLDGDGVQDLAVGAMNDENLEGYEGAIYILFMNADGTVKDDVKISDQLGGFYPSGLGKNDYFGSSIANIGDLDDDGVQDLAVGAYADEGSQTSEGAIYILFMNRNGTVSSNVKISDRLGGFVPSGLDAYDNFGTSITNMGDLDGDGIQDLAVGATIDENTQSGEGAIYLLFMNTNGSVSSNVKISDRLGGFVPSGLDANDYFGKSITNMGDLNGDGGQDLAVGAHYDENLLTGQGAVYILFLDTGLDTLVPLINFSAETTNSSNLSQSTITSAVIASDEFLDTVIVYLYNSTDIINTTVTNGSITLTYFNLSDGIYYINATANDTSSNNATTETRMIVLDTISPEVVVVAPIDGFNTTSSSYNFTINATDVTQLSCSLLYDKPGFMGDVSIETNSSVVSGINTTLNYSSFENRTHTWFVNCTDAAGNSNLTIARTLTVDPIPPELTIISPTNNSYFGGLVYIETEIIDKLTNVDYAWYFIYNNSNVSQQLFNGTMNLTGNWDSIWNSSVYPDVEWNITFSLYANDTLNNTVNTNVSFFLDNVNPTIQLIAPPVFTKHYNSNFSLEIYVQDSTLNYTYYNLSNTNGTQYQYNSSSHDPTITSYNWTEEINLTNLPDGNYNLTVYALDGMGNSRLVSTIFIVDTVSPNITLNYPTENLKTNETTITFNWTLADNFATSFNCNLTINGSVEKSGITCTNNSACNYTVQNFTWAEYTWNITCTDNATNIYTNGSVFIPDWRDVDNDTFHDDIDNLLWFAYNVTQEGVTFLNITEGNETLLNITVDGDSNLTTFNGSREVLFYDNSTLLVNFTHNFSNSILDLSNVILKRSSTYTLINLLGQLQGNKTMYLEDNNFVKLCVKDMEIEDISEMENYCDGEYEYDFIECIGNDTGITIEGITCTDEGSIIRVDNLQYSAIRGVTDEERSWSNIIMPEGVFEPYNASLSGTHTSNFSIRFVDLILSSFDTLVCDIKMSNGSILTVSETGINSTNQSYSLNYTILETDSIVNDASVGYVPWIVKNCSIMDDYRLAYNESTDSWAADKTKRIYVHDDVYWTEGEITRAVACAGTPGMYFNNTAKCEYGEDTKFAIQMYAGSPTNSTCMNNPGVAGESEYCRSMFFPTNDPLEYFGGMSALVDDPNGYATFTVSFSTYDTPIGYTRYVDSSGTGKFKLRLVETLSNKAFSVTIYNITNASAISMTGPNASSGTSALTDNGDGTWNAAFNRLSTPYTGVLDFTMDVDFDAVLNENRTFKIVLAYGGDTNQLSPTTFPVTFNSTEGYSNNNESEGNESIYSVDAGNRCGDEANNDFDYLGGTWAYSYDCFDLDCNGSIGDESQTNEFSSGNTGICSYGTEAGYCNDTFDNDYDLITGDDFTDCHDSDCFNNGGNCPIIELVCNDSINNDWDYTLGNTDSAGSQKIQNNGTKYDATHKADLTDCEDVDCNNSVGGSSGELCSWGYELNCTDGFDNDALQLADCDLNTLSSATDQILIGDAEYDCAATCRNVTGNVTETGAMCDDNLDNDWDAIYVTSYYAGSINTTNGTGIDCRWGGYFDYGTNYQPDEDCNTTILSNGNECQLAVELNCTDGFDNDFDNDALGMPNSGWSRNTTAYFAYYNVSYSIDADFDDYDCSGIQGAIANESVNASFCFDNIDNDLDAYYFNDSWISNASTGIDCFDPDCLGITNPANENQTCLSAEYNASDLFFTSLPWPGMYCANGLDDDADATIDCSDSDCSKQFDMCSTLGPCYATENKTWDSCYDGIDNDDGIGSDGTDCADSDCVGMFGSGNGGLCETAETDCDDGVDNDADGNADCADTDCAGEIGGKINGTVVYCAATESGASCSDGFDNDNDGSIDCYDSGCNAECSLVEVSGNNPISLPQYSGQITLTGINSASEGRVDQSTDEIRNGEIYSITFKGLDPSSDIQWTLGTAGNQFDKTKFDTGTAILSGTDAASFTLTETANGFRLDSIGLSGIHTVTFSINATTILSSSNYELIFYDGTNGRNSPGNTVNYQVHENVVPAATEINVSPQNGIDYGGQIQIRAIASDGSAFGRCEFNITESGNNTQNANNCKITYSATVEGIYNISVTPKDKYSNMGTPISTSYDLNIRPAGSTTVTDERFYVQTDTINFNASFNVVANDVLGSGQVYVKNSSGAETLIGTCSASGNSCVNSALNISGLNNGTYSIFANVTETTEGDIVMSESKGIYVCTGTEGACAFVDFDSNSKADVCGLDTDLDGLLDEIDPLWFNEPEVNISGFSSLNITVSGNDTTGIYSGMHEMLFYYGSTLMMKLNHNFTEGVFDLSNVEMVKTSASFRVNLSGQVQGNKTLYLVDEDFIVLCVKNEETSDISEMSSGCDGSNEFDFTACLGGSMTRNGLVCVDEGTLISVSNLQYSALRGTPAVVTSDSPGSSGSSGGGSYKSQCIDGKDNDLDGLIDYPDDPGCLNESDNTEANDECLFDSDCDVASREVCLQGTCVKLFDIKIIEYESPIEAGSSFEFTYFMKGMADINGDVEVSFWIEKDGEKVVSGTDVIYMGSFEEKTEMTNMFLPSDVVPGTYVFFVQVIHENYQVEAHRTVEVIQGDAFSSFEFCSEVEPLEMYLIIALIILVLLLSVSLSVSYFKGKNVKAKRIDKRELIKKYKIAILLFLIPLVFLVLDLVYCFGWFKKIMGFVSELVLWGKINIVPSLISYWYYVLSGIVVFGLLILVIVLIKKKSKNIKAAASRGYNKISSMMSTISGKINNVIVGCEMFLDKYKVLILTGLSSLMVVILGLLAYHFEWYILFFNWIKPIVISGKIKAIYILDVYGDYILIGIIAFVILFGLIRLLRKLEITIRIKKDGRRIFLKRREAKEKRLREEVGVKERKNAIKKKLRLKKEKKQRRLERKRDRVLAIQGFFHHFGFFKTESEVRAIAKAKELKESEKIREKEFKEKQKEEVRLREEEGKKRKVLESAKIKQLGKETEIRKNMAKIKFIASQKRRVLEAEEGQRQAEINAIESKEREEKLEELMILKMKEKQKGLEEKDKLKYKREEGRIKKKLEKEKEKSVKRRLKLFEESRKNKK